MNTCISVSPLPSLCFAHPPFAVGVLPHVIERASTITQVVSCDIDIFLKSQTTGQLAQKRLIACIVTGCWQYWSSTSLIKIVRCNIKWWNASTANMYVTLWAGNINPGILIAYIIIVAESTRRRECLSESIQILACRVTFQMIASPGQSAGFWNVSRQKSHKGPTVWLGNEDTLLILPFCADFKTAKNMNFGMAGPHGHLSLIMM